MMASSLLTHVIFVSIFAAIVWKWENVQAATRWQPSIIWDGLNPLLKCKCNWMNIPQLDIYDRVELLCPTPELVSAFRTHDVSKAKVYYNIFMRKFDIRKKNIAELRKSLDNGSFCDPKHKETTKLDTCKRNGASAYKLRIHSDEKLYERDIAVIFCNKDTGELVDLTSNEKKCAMVFIVNVTMSRQMEYGLSYDKCFTPAPKPDCTNINKSPCPCRGDPELETTSTTTQKPSKIYITGSTTTQKPSKIYITGSTTTQKPSKIYITDTAVPTSKTDNTITPKPDNTTPVAGGRQVSQISDDNFQVSAFAWGIFVGIIVLVVPFVIYKIIVKKKKGIRMVSKRCGRQNGQATVTKNGNENEAVRKQSQDTGGFSNSAFEPVTPTAPPAEDSNDYVIPKNPRAFNGRLPSVETSGTSVVCFASTSEHAPNLEKQEDPYEVVT